MIIDKIIRSTIYGNNLRNLVRGVKRDTWESWFQYWIFTLDYELRITHHDLHKSKAQNDNEIFIYQWVTMQNKVRYFRFMNQEMTQQGLAEKAGVTRQTIIAIEKGDFNPSVKLALKFARIFGTPVETIFMLEENDWN